mmetsp:Transcript_48010/g.85700  ORF Transcript_48010/g.85700 Transcript_48010/m.85700 type:complete len:223 (+) Transcript_48010:886-1554(+)
MVRNSTDVGLCGLELSWSATPCFINVHFQNHLCVPKNMRTINVFSLPMGHVESGTRASHRWTELLQTWKILQPPHLHWLNVLPVHIHPIPRGVDVKREAIWLYADGVCMESGIRFECFVMHQLFTAQGKAHEVYRVLSPMWHESGTVVHPKPHHSWRCPDHIDGNGVRQVLRLWQYLKAVRELRNRGCNRRRGRGRSVLSFRCRWWWWWWRRRRWRFRFFVA